MMYNRIIEFTKVPRNVVAFEGVTEAHWRHFDMGIIHTNPQKVCSSCKEKKETHLFSIDKSTRDGRQSMCKDCHKKSRRQSYLKNKEKEKARAADWLKRYPEKKAKQQSAWYNKNRERVIEKSKQWAVNNRAEFKINQHNRRVKIRNTHTPITKEQWNFLLEYSHYKCMCCGSSESLSLDHIVPISRGGKNTFQNIQVLCRRCNSTKSAKTIDYRPAGLRVIVLAETGTPLFK